MGESADGRPKAWYHLNTDTPHDGFRDYRGLGVPFVTSAVLQTLTPGFLFFSLIASHLLCSPFSVKWHAG